MDKVLVSICCITYNHADFIRDCIEGFLMQKTNFKFEIIINDDCSTDGTTEILKEYAERYPDIVIPVFHEENQFSIGVRGMFVRFVYPRAEGKYIAVCEGDDYWTDPLKLQRQVDLLEDNSKLSGCFHSCIINYVNTNERKHISYNLKKCIDFKTYLDKKYFITMSSLVFRKDVLNLMPPYATELFAGDFVLKYLILVSGNLGYINNPMSVYRKGVRASWSKRKITEATVNKEYFDNLRVLFYIDELTSFKHHAEINRSLNRQYASFLLKSVKFNSFFSNISNLLRFCTVLTFRENARFLMELVKKMRL